MSRRITIASFVLIAIGSGLIPGGIFINDTIRNMVATSVDEGLLGIQEEALPMVEDMLAEYGIPSALRGIREKGLKETEAIVNATFFMFLLNMTYHEPPVLGVDPFSLLFDRWIQWILIVPVTYSSALNGMGYPPIKGISEYYQQNLWYGNAKYVLVEGNGSLPGLIGNNSLGFGVLEYLALYDQANGNTTNEQELAIGYNTTWNKLTKLTDYYRNYFVPVGIPMLVANLSTIMPEYAGMDTMDIAEMYFYDQWANCSLFEGGIDFSTIVKEIDAPLYGFEVGRLIPSNITRTSVDLLWDDNNIKSLTNDTGIKEWIAARSDVIKQVELQNEFLIEKYQMEMLMYWLWSESFKWNIVPVLATLPPPDGVNMSLTEYARIVFLEVWANGTAAGSALFPYGFPLSLKKTTVYGFEVGYQDKYTPIKPTNMSLAAAELLWDVSNNYSLVNKKGLSDWYGALEDPTSATAYGLKIVNQLEDDEMAMIFEWLPKFRDEVMPYLAQEDMNLPMDSKSLGNTIQIVTNVPGGLLIGVASIGLIRNLIIKKRLR